MRTTTTTNERERHYYIIKHKTKREEYKALSLFRALCFLSSSTSQRLLLASSICAENVRSRERKERQKNFRVSYTIRV